MTAYQITMYSTMHTSQLMSNPYGINDGISDYQMQLNAYIITTE